MMVAGVEMNAVASTNGPRSSKARKAADVVALLQRAEYFINRSDYAEALGLIAKAKELVAAQPVKRS